ncbi:glycine zipper 2TM domain-containing protein [Novosphingobium album (ex Liu et al. 2023)]|uniref:17 kDa surface antigen n=1 Tax=Novosphingobium album (ex Liu et al. 2023) TaxID=3031130 RepID=A0ABT5WP11_9SPHN|nr:glycine zipper 2TM domain-containing protein [Novosphingobium album (ex Liu et al. 2023)]MDE8651784.1 glycine zipper 2TM domain-containing protein [Novosphingobium album (ex Liu et al. 2023)]
MRLRQIAQTASAAAAAMIVFGAAPAFAHDGHHRDDRPEWHEDRPDGYPGHAMPRQPMIDPQARAAWLADCRQRVSHRDNGLGGAAIGGLIGGVAGNRIAGKGDRTVGTIAGAAVGAAAGMAIDKAEDQGRSRDECEAYLDDYYAQYSRGYPGYGYPGYAYGASYPGYGYGYPAYGYGNGCCMSAPVMMVPVRRAEPECTETIEYVYEDVPVRPRPRPAPRKPVKVVPDKRVKVVPIK